jgi:hypothetical protein
VKSLKLFQRDSQKFYKMPLHSTSQRKAKASDHRKPGTNKDAKEIE